jgi:hypothetical protein
VFSSFLDMVRITSYLVQARLGPISWLRLSQDESIALYCSLTALESNDTGWLIGSFCCHVFGFIATTPKAQTGQCLSKTKQIIISTPIYDMKAY